MSGARGAHFERGRHPPQTIRLPPSDPPTANPLPRFVQFLRLITPPPEIVTGQARSVVVAQEGAKLGQCVFRLLGSPRLANRDLSPGIIDTSEGHTGSLGWDSKWLNMR